ncbi:histone-lysine N-methyltransferase SUV39H2-like [Babylonia areolata]|uniref:histone-lysine N-methyltransferase SUV39H2-like n=1 Tax=Babylonia areolata TaxID=304850 RepID=UPI003FD17913
MERANVRCLSDVVGLQRACQTENLRFSTETNKFLVYQTLQKLGPSAAQKLVSKLVDDGFIAWEEDEDYEVEDILDHADEDGKRYYLIKWQGWSHFHNSWEPAENLHCPTVVADYLAACKKSNSKTPVKRSLPKISESAQITKRRKVDEIFHKLWCSPISSDMSPLQLLTMHKNRIGPKSKQIIHKGLVSSHDRIMRPKFSSTAPNYANTKKKVYKLKKKEIQNALKEWERKLNTISTDPAPILVENEVDLEGPPENFEYINDYRAGEGIEIPQDPLIGCECENCFDEKKSCCGTACGSEFAYYRWKRLRVPRGTPIYECNKRCKCGPECPNRVVQEGRKIKVCVFRTSNGRGWGVKTMQKIKKGTFVMEYVGEVITNEEAERRGKVYDAECRTYLFDLDYNDGDCPFTVDAGYYGNVSHFVNHSCEPNLVVFGVWINTLDPRLPRICLFADRDIEKGEELTFDYMMTGDTTQSLTSHGSLAFPLHSSPDLEAPDLSNDNAVEPSAEPDSANVGVDAHTESEQALQTATRRGFFTFQGPDKATKVTSQDHSSSVAI